MKRLKGLAVVFVVFLLSSVVKDSFAAPVPLIKIEGPIDGQVLETFIVELKFSLKNFTFKDYQQVLKNNPNQGHLHIWLDKETPTSENAIMYYKASPYTFADVLPGAHTLVLELVNNDHTSFDPQIKQTIKFETKAPAGSEAAPLKPEDAPKVAVSKTGEVPSAVSNSASGTESILKNYFVLGLGVLVLGFFGIFILRR